MWRRRGPGRRAVRPARQPLTNRLIDSNDPYLLLHARNPVDWYPWGPEALAKAKRENKPIFLSVGYSTCFWCHVAEETIYSEQEFADLMNGWFVNIKVSRERRPEPTDLPPSKGGNRYYDGWITPLPDVCASNSR